MGKSTFMFSYRGKKVLLEQHKAYPPLIGVESSLQEQLRSAWINHDHSLNFMSDTRGFSNVSLIGPNPYAK
jgi:hypothetical protein